MLDIEVYNNSEKKGYINLSNRFIRAFRAGLFERGGFPTRVYDERELVRYIDSQHSECFERYFNELCEGITDNEIREIIKATQKIYHYTVEKYNKEFLVKAPILDAIYCLRVLKAVTQNHKSLRVMEIGAGSGILGCLLLQQGYKYICTDVAQAFYLIQNQLFGLFTDDIQELVIDEAYDINSDCIHVPYWKLWDLRGQEGGIDVFICNHAILEMHLNAIRFYLKMAQERMKRSKGGYFIIRGFGWNVERSLLDMLNDFKEFDFNLIYFDFNKEVAVYGLEGESVFDEVYQCMQNPQFTEKKEYNIYSLGKNLKAKITNCVYASNGMGNIIKMELVNTQSDITIYNLIDEYDKITKIQDSPDEEFANYWVSK